MQCSFVNLEISPYKGKVLDKRLIVRLTDFPYLNLGPLSEVETPQQCLTVQISGRCSEFHFHSNLHRSYSYSNLLQLRPLPTIDSNWTIRWSSDLATASKGSKLSSKPICPTPTSSNEIVARHSAVVASFSKFTRHVASGASKLGLLGWFRQGFLPFCHLCSKSARQSCLSSLWSS